MPDEERNAEFENLLEYIQRSRGFDYSGYKRPGLQRRVMRRMQLLADGHGAGHLRAGGGVIAACGKVRCKPASSA